MKYALAAAAMATAAAALPQDWSPVTSTTSAWSEVPTTTSAWSDIESSTTSAAWSGYTTPAANTWSNVDTTTCYSTWTTTVYGGNGNWNSWNVETSTSTLYNDQCTWATVPATSTWATAPVAVTTWATAPVKVCTYVTVYDKSYVTKSCGSNSGAWDNCKDVTTSSKYTATLTDAQCTGTWSAYGAPAAASTWSAAPVAPVKGASSPAPVAASSTWAPAPVAATSSVWAPVGKYTGAADKQAIGFGAAAIAAVAMML